MLKKVASILVAGAALAACGQKGPLTYPGVPEDAPWPYPVTPREPAPTPTPTPAPAERPGTTDDR